MKRAKRQVKGRRKKLKASPENEATETEIKKEPVNDDEVDIGPLPYDFETGPEVDIKVENLSDEAENLPIKEEDISDEEDENLPSEMITRKKVINYSELDDDTGDKRKRRKKFTKEFKCDICHKTFINKNNIEVHMRIHTGDRPYKCEYCDQRFVRICSLHKHAIVHINQTPFRCDKCDAGYSSAELLMRHRKLHTDKTPYVCYKCEEAFSDQELLVHHMQTHTYNKPFTCDECGGKFKTRATLKNHLIIHTDDRRTYSCKNCEKKFLHEQYLAQHIRVVHQGYNSKKCNICGKSFKGNIDSHMRLHSDLREFKCTNCEATFIQKSQLNVHMRTHTGERPYPCQVCGISFSHTTVRRIHMRSHTGEKPFQCIKCPASFKQLPHLKKHMRCVHKSTKPYVCRKCDDAFINKEQLDNHESSVHQLDKRQEVSDENLLANIRQHLAIAIHHHIGSEDRLGEIGYGSKLIDDVLKELLKSSDQTPIEDESLSNLEELKKNAMVMLEWVLPKDKMILYQAEEMTLTEMLEGLTSDPIAT